MTRIAFTDGSVAAACLLLLSAISLVHAGSPPSCSGVPVLARTDCGYRGIKANECEARGCCFDVRPSYHECYRPKGTDEPPADWAAAVAAGDMLFTVDRVDAYNHANIGNGFLALKLGPICTTAACTMNAALTSDPDSNSADTANSVDTATATGPHADRQLGSMQFALGGLHLAGVFNGLSNATAAASHRARLPAVFNYELDLTPDLHASNATLFYIGAALDVRRAIFFNRTELRSPRCAVAIEQRWYAHRANRSILVHELEMKPLSPVCGHANESDSHAGRAAQRSNASCSLQLVPLHLPWANISDYHVAVTPGKEGAATVAAGCTVQAEVPGYSNASCMAMAYDPLPATVDVGGGGSGTRRFLLAAHSSVEVPGSNPAALATTALATHTAATAEPPATQRANHEAAWAELWDAGFDIGGNVTVARAINSSLYYILSALRADTPQGLSPGGLATNSYDGQCVSSWGSAMGRDSFWDTETWMYPALSPLYPDLGSSLLQYRLDRVRGAELHARWQAHKGAMFPWESAFTGLGVEPGGGFDSTEQHVSADIGLAVRLYYRTHVRAHASQARAFLTRVWPLLNGTCTFWDDRLQAQRWGSGNEPNFTVKGVVGPDESSGVQDDDCYTNAASTALLAFCVEAAGVLGRETPKSWAIKAARPYLPLTTKLYSSPVHAQYTGYNGHTINQATVALLQYPLSMPMPRELAVADLKYYESVTATAGFFTGDSVYSIAWLRLNSSSAAEKQWAAAFAHQDPRFNLWHETTTVGHSNFITGAGGFLQNVLQGFAGMHVTNTGGQLWFQPRLPPGVTRLTLRRVCFQSAVLRLDYGSNGGQLTRRSTAVACAPPEAGPSAATAAAYIAEPVALCARARAGAAWQVLPPGGALTFGANAEIAVCVGTATACGASF